MRLALLGTLTASLAVGCRTLPLAPGEPGARLSPTWIQGEPTQIVFTWPNATQCDDEACIPPVPPLTIVQIACHGCDVIGDPTGTTTPNWSVVTAVATTDGPITIDATLRFDATGDQRLVTVSTTGDHEVAVEAECKLIDASELTASKLRTEFPVALFRACGATRRSSETAVVFPVIRTAGGAARFPFCIGNRPCTTYYGSSLRPIAGLSIAPEPTSWASTTASDHNEFAVLPADVPGPTVSVSTPLAGGAVSTASVAIPTLP
jgi:hypothetical protein